MRLTAKEWSGVYRCFAKPEVDDGNVDTVIDTPLVYSHEPRILDSQYLVKTSAARTRYQESRINTGFYSESFCLCTNCEKVSRSVSSAPGTSKTPRFQPARGLDGVAKFDRPRRYRNLQREFSLPFLGLSVIRAE